MYVWYGIPFDFERDWDTAISGAFSRIVIDSGHRAIQRIANPAGFRRDLRNVAGVDLVVRQSGERGDLFEMPFRGLAGSDLFQRQFSGVSRSIRLLHKASARVVSPSARNN